MDLYDLMKAGSLIFSRAPARDMAMIEALKEDRANKKAISNAFGPDTSPGPNGQTINWDTPRGLPSGNVTALMQPPEQASYPKFAQLPSIPMRANIPEVRASGEEEMRQKLMKAPAFQEMAAQRMFSLPKPPTISKPGDVARDANGNIIWQNDPLPGGTPKADLATLSNGKTYDLSVPEEREEATAARAAGATVVKTPPVNVDLNMGGDRAVTGVDAKRYESTTAALGTLDAMAPFLDRMQIAMQNGAQTGFGQEWVMGIKQAANEWLGADLKGTDEQEIFQSLQNYLGPKMRTQGSGSSSDRDVALYLSSIPSLAKTEQGNAALIQYYGKIRDYYTKVAEIQQTLLRENDYIPIAEERRLIAELGPLFTREEREQLSSMKKAPAPPPCSARRLHADRKNRAQRRPDSGGSERRRN